MRVLSGFLKSRVILGDNIDGTRPTMNRVKNSLFSMINYKINDSICLDLFAGSGALGIEAISNGAKKTYFVDNNKKCIEVIKKNISNLKIDNNSIIYFNNYDNFLKLTKQKFDIVFLDPPYKLDVISDVINLLTSNCLLNEDALIIVEYSDIIPSDFKQFTILKQKKYGDKNIIIYQFNSKNV